MLTYILFNVIIKAYKWMLIIKKGGIKMNSFKKITSLALAFAMIITSMVTTFGFAAAINFEDVTETTAYSQAIYNLVEEGIINGYDEDGKKLFKPDATITRAEFSKVLSMAKEGANALFGQTTTTFPDMAGSEWAIPYVAHASGAGIVKGYEDGTFGPKNPVTYAEAVTMIVRALGYEPVVDKTLTPWYAGYIKIANQIGVTKEAGGIPDNGAPRGLVAQLCDNMLGCKRLVQTGFDDKGNPKYEVSDKEINIGDDEDEDEGIVVAVFGSSLRGSDDNLTKGQIKIDGEVYAISDELRQKDLSDYLGKRVKYTYTGSSKYTVTGLKYVSGSSDLVITEDQLHAADLSEIKYFENPGKDIKVKSVSLDANLYVVYNGVGVPKASITSAFAATYMNGIETGDITLINNDSDSAYDVAYINNYKTYYVSAPTHENGVTTIYDKFSFEPKLALDEDDVTVTKVSTAGGSATNANISGIYNKSVVSVAAPLNQTDGTKVVISSATVSGEVTSMSGDYEYVEIGGKEYTVSPYFRKLLAKDAATYGFDISSNIKCYLDFQGRIVCTEVTESTDPYGYLVNCNPGSGMDSKVMLKIFTENGKWLEGTPGKVGIKLADRVRVDGQTKDAEAVPAILLANASIINSGKGANITKNATYSQVIKYRTGTSNGETVITDLYTIQGGSESSITPYAFSATGGTKAPYTNGTDKLKYSKSGYTFSDNGGKTQFTLNTTTSIVFVVPGDRTDDDKYKKRTYSGFSDATSYIVEPYEVASGSTSARVVVQYVADGATTTNIATSGTNVSIIVDKVSSTNPDTGNPCHKIVFRTFGAEKDATYYSPDLTMTAGFKEGDLVKYTHEGQTIEDIKLVYSANTLYEKDGTTVASDNDANWAHGSDNNYYYAIMGTVYAAELNDSGAGALRIVPGFVVDNGDGTFSLPSENYKSFTVKENTPYYEFDSTSGTLSIKSYGNLTPAIGSEYPETAAKVVLVRINEEVKGVLYVK